VFTVLPIRPDWRPALTNDSQFHSSYVALRTTLDALHDPRVTIAWRADQEDSPCRDTDYKDPFHFNNAALATSVPEVLADLVRQADPEIGQS
jgi:hypothetical protein